MIKKTSLNEVLAFRAQKSVPGAVYEATDGIRFDDVTGFHLYGDLGLRLRLAAAEDARNADKFLDILEEYAQIGEACSGMAGAVLLEVQGRRLHFLLPAPAVTDASIKQLLQFSIALTRTVYDKLKAKAGADWDGFTMAADHGRAIILATGKNGDDSVVSLGDAANVPAKRLARTPAVKAGHLALRSVVAARSPLLVASGVHQNEQVWVEINVKEPADYLAPVINVLLENQMNVFATAMIADRHRQNLVTFATANDLAERATIDNPIEVRAICMRADLDGFSQQVREAFAVGTEHAIHSLIRRFIRIMDFPDEFRKRIHRTVISLPWAGDCATQILPLAKGESWESLRKTLPATAAIAWHDCDGGANGDLADSRITAAGTRWSIGIAGGDEEEGSSGRMLVANIRTRTRQFRVASGWNAQRSLDAQQADNVVADDTVLHATDYKGLNSDYQLAFKELSGSSIFRRATLSALKRARQNQINAISVQHPVAVPAITGATIPASKPWAYET